MIRGVRISFSKFEHISQRQCAKVHSLINTIVEPVTDHNKYRILEDVITPLARLPYEKQLLMKSEFVKSHVEILTEKKAKHTNILPISPSPMVDHYRNKDEFNVLMGSDGNPKTFGFFTGNLGNKSSFAVSPIHLRNVKPEHKQVLQVFEEFVRKSPLPPCYLLHDGGYWRQILIRSNFKGDIMAVVVVHPQNRSSEEINEEKQQLIQHFNDNNIQLHSLYYHLSTHVKGTEKNSQLTLIHGEPYIYEDFFQFKFRISPLSFFQINVKAAEVLHSELFQLAQFKDTNTLLDLCCGVGTFSISFAGHVRNGVGVEHSTSSMHDALANCSINDVKNCFFTLGRLEERLSSVYSSLENVHELVVILNPGRSGVHPRVIELLLTYPLINKILYISCKPDNRHTVSNVASLMKKRKNIQPFKLKAVKPVDLFPHTIHYEMIMQFER